MCATPLTLAETASVFGEMLTFRALLDNTKDSKSARPCSPEGRGHDQHGRAPDCLLRIRAQGPHGPEEGELTSDQIGELWMSVQAESLGPAIDLSGGGYETYWSYIPHFIHSPFYVYAYAFGDCLVNSLYAVYQNAAEGFQDKYFALLKAGAPSTTRNFSPPSSRRLRSVVLGQGTVDDRRADR